LKISSEPALGSLRLALGASGSEEESPDNKIILKFQSALSDEKISILKKFSEPMI
jgi:hypothetical protein